MIPRSLATTAALLVVLTATLAAAGCSQDVPEAEQDDKLVIYSAGPRTLAEEVIDAWEEETGIGVEFFGATTGQVMARLEAERHRPRADVVILASRAAAEHLKTQERLLRYPDPTWLDDTREAWHDPEHYYFATSAAIVGAALRGALANEEPEWADLLGGDFPGQVTMPSPSRSGSAADFTVAYLLTQGEMGWADFLAARRSGLDFAGANSQAISGLLVGTYDVIVGAVDYLIYRQIADGENLRMHYPQSGSVLVERPIAIMADTPVPERAREFVDFYQSRAMQQQVAKVHLLPARADVPVSDARGDDILPPLLEVDVQAALARQQETLRRFQLEIERAEIVRGDG